VPTAITTSAEAKTDNGVESKTRQIKLRRMEQLFSQTAAKKSETPDFNHGGNMWQ
jgi:hypothetical protein